MMWSSSKPCPNCGKKAGIAVKCTNCGTLGCEPCIGKAICQICKKPTKIIRV